MPARFSNDCLGHDELWSDHSAQANAVTRDSKTNTLCLAVMVWEKGECVQNYALRQDNPVLLESEWYQLLLRELQPHLGHAS
ncbi:MAG: hypothetical protein ACXW3Z_14380 [Limisphaerales bacterium]